MQLHLVRHGQTAWNAERRIQGQLDTELDDTGREQARALAPTLAAVGFGAVYCSTSLRTRETATLALTPPHPDIVYRDELREIRLGVWQGRHWTEIEAEDPAMVARLLDADPAFEVEGAESYPELQARGVAAIERIVAENAGEAVLVVSHGALLKSVLMHYAGYPLTTLRARPSLPNCAHCIVETEGARRTIVQFAGSPVERTDWAGKRASATVSGQTPPPSPRSEHVP